MHVFFKTGSEINLYNQYPEVVREMAVLLKTY